MEIEETLEEIITQLLTLSSLNFKRVNVTKEENENYQIDIESENPSEIIGHHGETIQALQHLLKITSWNKLQKDNFNIILDVDNYRKRQEDNAISLAERKIAYTRKTGKPQMLPAMSPYIRRKIHMQCMSPGFEDIETYSEGEGENRRIVVKLK